MGINKYPVENREFTRYVLAAVFVFSLIVVAIPIADARSFGNYGSSGLHGGHSRHHGGHSRSFGSNRHFGGGHSFGSHRGRHRSYRGHRSSSRRSYNYFPRSYGYSYTSRYYSPYSYSGYTPSYAPTSSYISRNTYPGGYSRNAYPSSYSSGSSFYGTHNVPTVATRYIEKNPPLAGTGYVENKTGSKVRDDSGWYLLAQNKVGAALNVFASQAMQHQNDGVYKVGYALSTAMQGDLERAAWTMRRAFRIDPNSLHYVKIEQPLRARIDNLIAEYNSRLNYSDGNNNSDPAFMIAALNYLIHNEILARSAIEEAVNKAGDNSQSAQNLYSLVVKR